MARGGLWGQWGGLLSDTSSTSVYATDGKTRSSLNFSSMERRGGCRRRKGGRVPGAPACARHCRYSVPSSLSSDTSCMLTRSSKQRVACPWPPTCE